MASHIGVTAHAGVIALSGHVESFVEKHAAETAARRVKGVTAVAEEIEVRLPFDVRRGDEEIAAAAVERLGWDVSVPKDAVKVSVENGWVTLTGEVEWRFQQEAAEQDMRGLFGVLGLRNSITIKTHLDATNISENIQHALKRSWFFDPKEVSVTAIGGTVRLTGRVRGWHDRELAESTAWAAPGVTVVINDIAVH